MLQSLPGGQWPSTTIHRCGGQTLLSSRWSEYRDFLLRLVICPLNNIFPVSTGHVDTVLPGARRPKFVCEHWRECENEVTWTFQKPGGKESLAPGRVQLVRDNEVRTPTLKQAHRRRNNLVCISRGRQAIHDYADAHVTEIPVLGHLHVEHDHPAKIFTPPRNPQTEKSRIGRGIKEVQCVPVPCCNKVVVAITFLPNRIGPGPKFRDNMRFNPHRPW